MYNVQIKQKPSQIQKLDNVQLQSGWILKLLWKIIYEILYVFYISSTIVGFDF